MGSPAIPTDRIFELGLIQQAQQGDLWALDELYRRYVPAIFRYMALRIHDPAAAEDLTAEVFVRMVKSMPGYRDQGAPFGAWLFRIAHDRAIDYLRHHARHPLDALAETTPDPLPGPEQLIARRSDTDEITAALASLTEEQRLIIQLRFVEGHSLKATAQLANKSIGAVKALQRRALQNLALRLG